MTVEELQVLITADTNNLRKEIQKTNSLVSGLQKTATKSSSSIFSAVLKGNIATKILSKTISLISQNMDGAINRLDTLNNFPRVMNNLNISSEDAEASLKRLSDGLIGLPTSLDNATLSVQRFTSANGNVEASTEMFLALNNAILAGGADMQIQSTALEQLSQAYAKGKPDMMEWRSAMTAMPAQLKQVAIAMGYVSTDQLGEALRSGQASMNDFMKTIIELNHSGENGFKSFEEQARNSTGGIKTSIVNAKTAITRGIAEIMNTIGQSNIAEFFQKITRAINSVIPYMVAFTKVMVTGVSYISSLFGKAKSVVGVSNKASNSLGNLGASGKNTSKGLDKASGSAKKLKKELNRLAGFDEMNVLSEPSDTSGSGSSTGDSGSGGGDLGNIDLSGFDTAISSTGNKVDELYEKMLNAIKQNINFDNITNALDKLWKALEPFGKTVGDGLLWLYDNVLLPISKIVINDILPGFLTLLAGAINILNTAIDEVKPVFEWLWNGFLEPVISWTGGVIADVLTAIGDALSWIAQNEVSVAILEGLAVAIGIVAVALNAINIAIGIFNVIGVIASAVTTAWGVAVSILTSPITLIILAITAVVAVVILLIKHWDEVKAVAQKVWDKVKEIWGVVATWFKEKVIEPIKEFFTPIVDFFKDIFTTAIDNVKIIFENLIIIASFVWDSIKAVFSVIGNWFKEKWEKAVNLIKEIFAPIGNFFSDVWEKIKNVFSVVGTFFKDVFNKAYNAVKNVFNPIVTFFNGIFTKIKNIFIKIGTTVGQVISGAFKGVVNGVLATIENVLNAPIKAINGLIKVINKVPGINLSTLKTFNLPRLARGGVVDKPMLAQIGEAGKEVVMPLERNTGWINELAGKIDERIDKSNNQPIQLVVKIGEDTILDKVINGIRQKDFETNGEVFNL